MKRINCSSFLLGLIFFLGATSCLSIKPLEFKGVNSFKISESSGGKGVIVNTNLKMYNPNSFKFIIKNADIDVFAEGINLGKLQIPDTLEIDSKKEFSGDFYIEISLTKLILSGRSLLSKIKSGKIELQLKGTIDTKILWMNKAFQINYNEKINMP